MSVGDRIHYYEGLLQNKLGPELEEMLSNREAVFHQISHYLDLKNKIQLIEEQKLKEMDVMMNIGAEFYVQTKMLANKQFLSFLCTSEAFLDKNRTSAYSSMTTTA